MKKSILISLLWIATTNSMEQKIIKHNNVNYDVSLLIGHQLTFDQTTGCPQINGNRWLFYNKEQLDKVICSGFDTYIVIFKTDLISPHLIHYSYRNNQTKQEEKFTLSTNSNFLKSPSERFLQATLDA